jgi:hypothetical protein
MGTMKRDTRLPRCVCPSWTDDTNATALPRACLQTGKRSPKHEGRPVALSGLIEFGDTP